MLVMLVDKQLNSVRVLLFVFFVGVLYNNPNPDPENPSKNNDSRLNLLEPWFYPTASSSQNYFSHDIPLVYTSSSSSKQ